MKLAIVCGHFVPEIGYLEVHLAKAIADSGIEVEVFTSNVTSSSVRSLSHKNYPVGISHINGHTVKRLSPLIAKGQVVFCSGLERAIDESNPNVIIVIGVGKLFPKAVYNLDLTKYKVITLFGDNEDSYSKPMHTKVAIKNWLIKRFLKNNLYKKAVIKSHKIYSYTPSTLPIVKASIPANLHNLLHKKNTDISLGFDPTTFFFDKGERETARKSLNLSKITGITATRVTRNKKLEELLSIIEKVNQKEITIQYIICGFMNDPYGNQLHEKIKSNKVINNSVICMPFVDQDKLRTLYNAADFGFWPTPAISILEAIGTGLNLLLPNKKSLSHLLKDEEMGRYFGDSNFEDKFDEIISSIGTIEQRKEIAGKAKKYFSYGEIIKPILSEIQ